LQLNLSTNTVYAGLADGTGTVLPTCVCHLDWFGQKKPVQAVVSDKPIPFIGAELMRQNKLTIDYSGRTVTIA
jgi:hypothetical protein